MQRSEELKQRLENGAGIISTLKRRREETGDENLGSNIERMIIDRELQDLEVVIGVAAEPAPTFLSRILRRKKSSVVSKGA